MQKRSSKKNKKFKKQNLKMHSKKDFQNLEKCYKNPGTYSENISHIN